MEPFNWYRNIIQIISLIILIFLFLIALRNKLELPSIERKYEISFLIGSVIVSNFFK